ncbi:hypothetical protein ACR9J8_05795 [Helicobacter pylori]|uniref:Uncharacterized protein n=1 Tax=Helicobacter pylori TaxID=210 RepID=A0A7Z6SR77_HELPX|nr:hypothetical protein [Helicobacter pylori]EMG91487.1 hypothetical protein HMPREF1399_01518 [Helicobacter pylori GAM118Bi]EMG91837.1 hypothetical protein HMPREF1403_00252 [Helicobacter pylori GAM201Ai]EMG92761.1 hypothetical protein HMPREF1400_01289 [Helicobacter pylori GAM119Bi]EMJ43495.1 hypothetical protein HMPREF1434_01051 [Helicobacter pylori GAMchJs124i]MBH0285586.1 hypothetical protein [Helicobacter pylori]
MRRELRLLNNKHCIEYLQFLSKNHLSFNLLCERDAIDFSPKLPKEIHEKFGSLVLFVLAGYTLESLMIDAQSVQFEAGFGPNNIGSVVQVGLSGIIQILIKEKNENIVLFNRCDSLELFQKEEPLMQEPKKDERESKEWLDSKEALFSNSKNRAILENLHKS